MNELRRTKKKLSLLTTEELPVRQLLFDFIALCYPTINPQHSIEYFSAQLKSIYNRKIEELEPKGNYVQQKMEL